MLSTCCTSLGQCVGTMSDCHHMFITTLLSAGVTDVKTQGFATALQELTGLTQLHITVRRVPDVLQFGRLPADLFRACHNLRTLAFNNCGVTAVPPEIAFVSGLTRLQLLCAKPTEGLPPPHVVLPPHFTRLRSLVNLQLSSASIPSAVFDMADLINLKLDQVTMNS